MANQQGLKIIINGKEYSSTEEIPPEIRARLKERFKKLSAGVVGRALFKNIGMLASGRAKDFPNALLQELMGDNSADIIQLSFDSNQGRQGPPQVRQNRGPSYSVSNSHSPQYRPGAEVKFEGSGKFSIPLIAAAAALLYFFRDRLW